MLSFEAQQFQGAASIVEKLAGLPFTTIKHQISTMDAQPAATDKASMIVLVTGQLLVSHPWKRYCVRKAGIPLNSSTPLRLCRLERSRTRSCSPRCST